MNLTTARSVVALSSVAELPHSSQSVRRHDLWVSLELIIIFIFMVGSWAQFRRCASDMKT
jgi:hypothetical protein